MNDLISVIVPVFNTGKYLERCVKSIYNQDYPNLEILLVDDGSTDSLTIKMCNEFAIKHHQIKLLRKRNGGSASARNFGILHAHGQYIGFVDSDDIIDKSMYSTLYSLIKKDGVKVAICGISVEENKKVCIEDKELKSGCYDNYELMHNFLLGHWHSACTCLYEKSLIVQNLFPEGEVNEDYVLNYQIFKELPTVSFTATPFYHYIRRDDSNTGAPKTLKFLDWITHTEQVLLDLKDRLELKREAEYQYLYSNIILANSCLLTLNRVQSSDAEKMYAIVTDNLSRAKMMLWQNQYLSFRNRFFGLIMAFIPVIYKTTVLGVLKLKKQ